MVKIPPIFETAACVFGLITNTLSVLVFLKANLKDSSFKYMLVTSFSDLLYLGLSLIAAILSDLYEADGFNHSYFKNIYLLWIDDYFTGCLAIFCILIDIVLALQRYLILLNKTCCQKMSHNIIMIVLLIISLIYYLPILYFTDVICNFSNQTNLTQCKAVRNQQGSSLLGNLSVILMSAFRIFLVIIILTSINILNSYEFKKRFRNYHSTSTMSGKPCNKYI